MNESGRRFLAITLGAIALSCLLGIGLDCVTANVAVEYFSEHHPRILPTDNPWALALYWGVAASWWFGAISGLVIAFINHRRQQPLPAQRILRWSAVACVILWLLMIAIMLTVLAVAETIPLEDRRETFDQDKRLVAVAMAHQFEYLLGAIALLVIAMMTWRAPPRPAMTSTSASSQPDQA